LAIGAIIDWREELAETIRGLEEDDWDHVVLLDARGQECFRVRSKELCVTITEITPEAAGAIIGKVNDADVAGVPAGHLLIKGVRWGNRPGPGRLLLVLNERPWNITYNPSQGTFVDFRDAAGQLVYHATDFGVIR
jgi:hypothetical protein